MTIRLDKDLEMFLQEQVSSGAATDVNQLVNSMVRSFATTPDLTITPEIEELLLEAADAPVAPLSPYYFKDLRNRVIERRQSSR